MYQLNVPNHDFGQRYNLSLLSKMLQRQASGSVLETLIFEAANFAEGKLRGRLPLQLGTALQFAVAITDSDVQLPFTY